MKQREIKFRAWDIHNKVMYDNSEIYLELGEGDDFVVGIDDGDQRLKKDKDAILIQYTGLRDKNGKEIYEGDIVKWTHPSFKEYKKEYKILEISDIRKSLMLEPDCQRGWIEIIGNIYQNKNLIKEKK